MNTNTFLNEYLTQINEYHKENALKKNKLPDPIIEKKKTVAEDFDIFETSNIKENEKHVDFYELTIDEKKDHIYHFLNRKKYKLLDENLDSLDKILEDNVQLKKMVHISKSHSMIEKLDFLKKVEHNEFKIVIPSNEKKKSAKKNFFKK